jgi:hypothetical protein
MGGGGAGGGVGEGMGVLRQNGLLSQVDPALLSRVQQVIGEPKEAFSRPYDMDPRPHPLPSTAGDTQEATC